MIIKEIINGEVHKPPHPWVCAIELETTNNYDYGTVTSWELTDWNVVLISTDWEYYEWFANTDWWAWYKLIPAIQQDKDRAVWYLLWNKIYIRSNFQDPEQ